MPWSEDERLFLADGDARRILDKSHLMDTPGKTLLLLA
jgi:hypothetical protein